MEKVGETVGVKVGEKVTENQRKILSEIGRDAYISAKELSNRVGISTRKIEDNIRKLKTKGLLRRIGPDKGACPPCFLAGPLGGSQMSGKI
jgi:ATP-dependent DNA helicase RecG